MALEPDSPLDIRPKPMEKAQKKAREDMTVGPPQPETPPMAPEAPSQGNISKLVAEQGKGTVAGVKEAQAINAKTMEMHPPPPAPHLPSKPEGTSNPLRTWGTLAMIFAMMGGHHTKRRSMLALRAATGMLNAMREGDLEEQKHAMQVWQQESENALNSAKYEHDAYKTIINDARDREGLAIEAGKAKDAETTAKLNAANAMFKDDRVKLAYERGGIPAAQAVLDDNERWIRNWKEGQNLAHKDYLRNMRKQQVMESDEFKEGDAAKQASMLAQVDSEFPDASKTSSLVAPLTPDMIEFHAQQIASGNESWPNQTALTRSQDWNKVVMRAKEINPSVRKGDWELIQKAAGDAGTGKAATALRSLRAARQHIEMISDLVNKMPGDLEDLPAQQLFINTVNKMTGRTDVTNFETARNVVGSEIAKAVGGATGMALQDREEIRQQLANSKNKAQLLEGLDTIKTLIGGQAGALDKQFDILPPEIKERYFDEDTKRFFGIGGEKPAAKPSGETKKEVPKAGEPGSGESNPVIVNSKEEYDALPSGTWVSGSNGVGKKP